MSWMTEFDLDKIAINYPHDWNCMIFLSDGTTVISERTYLYSNGWIKASIPRPDGANSEWEFFSPAHVIKFKAVKPME